MKPDHLIKETIKASNWRSCADGNKRCADLLWQKYIELEASGDLFSYRFYLGGAWLLYGYALEAGMKGLLIAKNRGSATFSIEYDGNEEITKAKFIGFKKDKKPVIPGHDLKLLANELDLHNDINTSITDDTQRDERTRILFAVLEFLSEVIVWSGKYPAPLDSKDDEREHTREFINAIHVDLQIVLQPVFKRLLQSQ